MAVHGEVGAEEQVGDGQQQRLGQRSSSVIIVELIRLERTIARVRLYPEDINMILYLTMAELM